MGDLDGDTYSFYWDKDIVDSFKANYPPAVNRKISKSGIGSLDPVDHIVYYLQRDSLGKLCDLHMALCDKIGVKGPKEDSLKALSSLIQESVDFAKHGKAV
jgi:hypothetical protein